MTTRYRVLVSCDGLRTPECHGVLELSTPYVHRLAQHADITNQGWHRAYHAGPSPEGTQSFDLCPVCRKHHEAETRAIAAESKKLAQKKKEQTRADS